MFEGIVGITVFIFSVIFAVIAFFIKRMIDNFDKKLDSIDNKIEFLIEKNSSITNDIKTIKGDVINIYDEIEKTNLKYNDLHTRLTIIEIQHNDYQLEKKGMKQ